MIRQAVRALLKRTGLDVRNARYHFIDPFADQRRLLAGVRGPLVVFDAGANEGQTIRQYLEIFPTAIIHSFEPTRALYDALVRTFGGMANVHLHPQAVYDAAGEQTLQVTSRSYMNSLLAYAPDEAAWTREATLVETVPIPTISIDDFCRERRIDHIHVLKLDIQGSELRALRGASAMLERAQIDLAFIEVCFSALYEDQPLYEDLAAYIRSRGYVLYGLYDFARDVRGCLGWANAIFLSAPFRDRMPPSFWSQR